MKKQTPTRQPSGFVSATSIVLLLAVSLTVALFPALSTVVVAGDAEESAVELVRDVTIRAERAHIGDGQIVENALIVIKDGIIQSVVSGGEVVGGGNLLVVSDITPGLIDANARIDV
ncbi:MAG TPA: hypothetical protein EYN40_08185, partial [Planctomycetes bacterium]|nr:hypothetical protein [Planctomycetota bacterium]